MGIIQNYVASYSNDVSRPIALYHSRNYTEQFPSWRSTTTTINLLAIRQSSKSWLRSNSNMDPHLWTMSQSLPARNNVLPVQTTSASWWSNYQPTNHAINQIHQSNQIKSTKSINQPNEQPYARAHGGYTPEIMNVSCVQFCHTNVSNDMHYYRQWSKCCQGNLDTSLSIIMIKYLGWRIRMRHRKYRQWQQFQCNTV